MKKAIITEGMYRRVLKENESPFDQEDIENLKRLLLSGIPVNVETVFSMLTDYPDVLDDLIDDTLGDLFYLLREKRSFGNTPSVIDIVTLLSKEALYLDKKNLLKLPKEIAHLKNLETISASYNNLKGLPETFSELQNLWYLELSYNEITSLPENIGNFQGLELLNLRHNNIQTLPDSLSNLKKLHTLNLRGNPLNPLEVETLREKMPGCDIIF